MIVKVVAPDPINAAISTRHFNAADDVQSGTHWFKQPPSGESLTALIPFPEANKIAEPFALSDEPTPRCTGEKGEPRWVTRFAFWYDYQAETWRIVVTSGRIFLMSDSGQTIDKVA